MTRRPKIRQGTVRNLTEGRVAVDFVPEFIDQGAPEFYVTGIASIERISPHEVRFTKYTRRRDGNMVTHHEVWNIEIWMRSFAHYEQALAIIERMPIGDGQEDKRGAH